LSVIVLVEEEGKKVIDEEQTLNSIVNLAYRESEATSMSRRFVRSRRACKGERKKGLKDRFVQQ
jgi:hypothetical protein